ncbi:ABC transporter substrate-binding protein [Cryptosporangium sp. NPDC051539]|uniref:ABC transporter substrate-binding protein n=1 Tax=Cryptosporangium sp. NPDC051539 TaxID=3363962 RepID=UPI00378C40E5
MRRLRLASAVAATLLLSVTACSGGGSKTSQAVEGDWGDVVAAAEKEGSVLLYSSQNPVNLAALKTAFHKKYPKITMTFVRGTDAELNPKVEVEQRTGKGIGDVHMLTDASWIKTAASSGKFSAELRGPDFDESGYNRSKTVMDDRMFLSSAAVFSLGWNTQQVPGGLKDPRDLLKPEFKGKIGITNPQGIAAYVDFYRFMQKNYGDDYLTKLAALQPRVYPSALTIAQALTSGEIAATPVVQPLVAEVKAGAPVKWALPEKPWGTPWYSHVLSSAAHPNAAQVLADFIVTPEGQAALNVGYASAIPGVDGAVANAQDIPLPNPDDLTPAKNQAFQSEWESLFLRK